MSQAQDKRSSYSLWTERFRPITINELVLPKATKAMFRKIVTEGEVPKIEAKEGDEYEISIGDKHRLSAGSEGIQVLEIAI